jgi:hypothetical protein
VVPRLTTVISEAISKRFMSKTPKRFEVESGEFWSALNFVINSSPVLILIEAHLSSEPRKN